MSIDQTFDQRLRRVLRKHRRMNENGTVRRMGPDGLVSVYPRRRMPKFPLGAVVALFAVAFLFKAWLFTAMGADEYAARVQVLAAGAPVERAAAWVMHADPATLAVAQVLSRLGV